MPDKTDTHSKMRVRYLSPDVVDVQQQIAQQTPHVSKQDLTCQRPVESIHYCIQLVPILRLN